MRTMRYSCLVRTVRENHPAAALEHQADWQLARRVIGSRCFSKSERLRNFLHFIAERSLTGRAAEITEQRIGIEVFDRADDYNPAEDSIVRSHARLLRQRLADYYADEGKGETRRIAIPKGGYVVAFEDAPLEAAPAPPAEPIPPPAPVRRPWALWICAAGLCVLAGMGLDRLATGKPAARTPHPFWSRLFQANRNTLLVAADTGLVMYENLSKRTISLEEYLSRDYRGRGPTALNPAMDVIADLPTRRYTSTVDLSMALRLTRLPDVVPERFQVRFARDLQLQELKESNLIVSGALEANPWGELFRAKTNFQMDDDQATKTFTVKNLHPRPGERASYARSRGDRFAYGHIAYLPNLGDTGRVLILEGTGAAGTEAATDFVLNDRELRPLLERFGRPDGAIPDFEILVSTNYLDDGKSQQVKLVALRFGP